MKLHFAITTIHLHLYCTREQATITPRLFPTILNSAHQRHSPVPDKSWLWNVMNPKSNSKSLMTSKNHETRNTPHNQSFPTSSTSRQRSNTTLGSRRCNCKHLHV